MPENPCHEEEVAFALAAASLATAEVGVFASGSAGPIGVGVAVIGLGLAGYSYFDTRGALMQCEREVARRQQEEQEQQEQNNSGAEGGDQDAGVDIGSSSESGGVIGGGFAGNNRPGSSTSVEEIIFERPIALDLDGDGVELVSIFNSTARFDFDGDGDPDLTGWVAPDDGLLAYDVNGDGIISELSEISFVSYLEGARTDLEGLRAFDTNDDGVFGVGDDEYGSFYVWQDLNQDGVSDEGELVTLEEAGITSIDLTLTSTEQEVEGNIVHNVSTYTTTGGVVHDVADVSFAYAANQVATITVDIDSSSTNYQGNDLVDIFIFSGNHGDDTITNFDVETDILILNQVSSVFDNVDDIINAATDSDNGVVIDTGDGSITLAGLEIADLDSVQYLI
ncbi:hypothetical protein [Kordiimonas laminariae]|uniref:hypothetical protein n=1 Tax=Kordiimonas laminariae TaxID=2917717 RepID=UPI001FF64F5E|nr:hypothetical protein [Kordiimonas laminariae]MCK0068155.1 hypothetical protein [Kordiimonas laminariae]